MNFFLKKRLWVITVLFIVIILSGLLIYNPIFETDKVVSKNQNLPEIISLKTQNQTLEFAEPHEIFINSKLVDTTKSYILNKDNFTDGKSLIEFRAVKDYKLFTLKSKTSTNKTLLVDKTGPKITLEKPVKNFILLENQNILNINSDSAGKLKFENKEIIINPGLNEVILPVADGKNKYILTIEDEFENPSEVLEIVFEAFNKPDFAKIQCPGLSLPLNTKDIQTGYTGVKSNLSLSLNQLQDYINETKRFKCERMATDYKTDGNFFSGDILTLNPVGKTLSCTACEFIDSEYMKIKRASKFPDQSDKKDFDSQPYTTKTGIVGKLIKYNLDFRGASGGRTFADETIFEFDFKGQTLWLQKIKNKLESNPDYYKNQDKDFETILDNLVLN